ncbi:hypothetical protein N7510_002501 [Penicillium lagena]|uniref:uncharacterized protein n=1 Tax=Penicillium lagena TaxID=94218 RepID=UPI0025409631|nr:uncharacterized protein N7510_002501 [Penicillium lagena]KAJ5626192.1 hypothetical protein N7510_002501 [Penicillium lagena]
MTVIELDAVIVGAGLSGIYLLQRLRDELHLKVKIFEAAPEVGGVWYWNTYPGARVDCPVPAYAFDFEKVWSTWKWSQLYPDQKELQAYFRHVDQVMEISKDTFFNSRVNGAQFNPDTARWTVTTEDGKKMVAKYFIPAAGFAEQEHVPQWKGYETFEGDIHHTSCWPSGGVDVKGKRVAIIGTGATGVQVTQEWAKESDETFVFQRTPNYALPINQETIDETTQKKFQKETGDIFAFSATTIGGLAWHSTTKNYDDYGSQEELEKILNEMYDKGGFHFWTGGIADLFINPVGNRIVYDTWAKRVRQRVQDPVKAELLAPREPPHPFATKRPSLERDYYEQFNRPNVHIVDTNAHPILEIRPQGIVTDDGKLYQVDAIAVATGFDAGTGSLAKLNVRDVDGVDLSSRWKDGIQSFLGMTVPGFPNMFIPYSVQSPAPWTNGPVFLRLQVDWIRDMIAKIEKEGIRYIDPHKEKAQAWRDELLAVTNMTLFPKAKSWYMGANVPGKRVELMYFPAPMPMYFERCAAARDGQFAESFFASRNAA